MSLSFRLTAGRRRAPLRVEALEVRSVPAAAVGTNVPGAGANDFAPPDTNGAVGPNHYVQFNNGSYRVHTKTGSLVGAEITDNQFWINAGLTAATVANLSDPRILFDPLSNRWFAAEINLLFGPPPNFPLLPGNRILIARSNTADPTAGFKATSFVVGSTFFADY